MSCTNSNEIYNNIKNLIILSKEQINCIDNLSIEEKGELLELLNIYITILKVFNLILNIAFIYLLINLFAKFIKNIINSKENTVSEKNASFNLIIKDKVLSFNIKNK